MFDTEKFILLIQDHPCLWDKGAKEYSDRNIREEAWRTVARNVVPNEIDWELLDAKQKKKEIDKLKTKWRYIRDTFFRSLQTKTGSASGGKKKKYVYAECLNFLLTLVDKRNTSGNIDADEEEQNYLQNDFVNTEELGPLLPINVTQDQSQTSPTRFTISPKRRKTTPKKSPVKNFCKKGITPFQSALLQKLDNTDGKANSTIREEDDPDRMFLLSLLGDYKKLNDDEKLDFKLEVLQFFKRRRNPPSNFYNLLQENCNNSSPASSSQSHSQYAPSSPDSYNQSNFQLFEHSAPAPLRNMTPLSNTSTASHTSNLSITVPYSSEAPCNAPSFNTQPCTY